MSEIPFLLNQKVYKEVSKRIRRVPEAHDEYKRGISDKDKSPLAKVP